MLKDAGRLVEAEAAYRSALSERPDEADIYLQLGHCLKLQGRRAAAIDAYQRAAELAPLSEAPRRELFHAGQRPTQEHLFEEQLQLGGVDALMAVTQQLIKMQQTLSRLSEALPDLQAQTAFPVGCYETFRELLDVPAPSRAPGAASFAVLLLADREPLETLFAQIAAVLRKLHAMDASCDRLRPCTQAHR